MTALAVSQSLIDQPGTVAFLVVFGMGVMLFFVFRSMARHLRKINMAARAEAEAAARAGGPDGNDGPGGPDGPGGGAGGPGGLDGPGGLGVAGGVDSPSAVPGAR